MRLWVDGQCLQTESRLRGIGRYVTEFLRAISIHHPEIDISISFNGSMAEDVLVAREIVRDIIDPRNIHIWHGAAKGGEVVDGYTPERRLSELSIAHHVNYLGPDVALSASPFEGIGNPAVPLLPDCGSKYPIASIFYDAIPHRYSNIYLMDKIRKEYYYRRLNFHKRFDDNLCISEFSEFELKNIYKNANSINISAGISRDFILAEKESNISYTHIGNFILYVGALDWRKNVRTVLSSFKYLDASWPENNLKLVLAGGSQRPLIDEVLDLWTRQGFDPGRLVYLGHVSDDELVALYKHARLLVQPSFMEGFGLTALEAIYCGTPVLAARAGALPEVVGVDEFLFDPNSSEALAEAILRLLREESKTREILTRARDHAAQFTWKRTAAIASERFRELSQRSIARDIQASRREMVRLLKREGLDKSVAAHSFALAEHDVSGPPRLLVDASFTMLVNHRTGIQRVVKNICSSLIENRKYDIERHAIFCGDGRGCIKIKGKEFSFFDDIDSNIISLRNDVLVMLDSSWHLFLVHRRHMVACRLQGGEVVSCLYDTVPLKMLAMCNPAVPPVFIEWFKNALAYSSGFICISRAVADELLLLLEAIEFPRRMKVGYWQLGADFVRSSPPEERSRPVAAGDVRRPNFLMVGTLEPRKGHRVALEAFEHLWASDVDVNLVIVGQEGWAVEELARGIRTHPEYGKRLLWHAKVDDSKLASLYEDCDALIAASFAEGFGLPLVEAGHFGKPVIASDIPVFREVGVGAAGVHFFEVGSAKALAASVRTFLKGAGEPTLTTTPSRRVWPTWKESADQLEDVVLGGNWYRIYEPRNLREYAPLGDLGQLRMDKPLAPEERSSVIQLIEGPYRTDGGETLKIIIAVTNHSTQNWYSHGDESGGLAVNLSYHILDRDGAVLQYDNPRSSIPFVHIPGDTLYMPVTVPADWKKRGAAFVDIELVQEGVAWFGNALRVAL